MDPDFDDFDNTQLPRTHYIQDPPVLDIGGRDFSDSLPHVPIVVGRMKHHEQADSGLREYTTGHQPPDTLLHARNSINKIPDLDLCLRTLRVEIRGELYLPIASPAVRAVLEIWIKGYKPIADMDIFKRLVLNKSDWESQKDNVCMILRLVGSRCDWLVLRGGGEPLYSEEFCRIWKRVLDLMPYVLKIETSD